MGRSPISVLGPLDPDGVAIPGDRLETTFRHMLDEHGYVHLRGLTDEFDPIAFGRRLAPLQPHYNGALVAEVRPSSTASPGYFPGSAKSFAPHTEGYELAGLPPRYLALWCVRPASGAGGQTTLADTLPWLAELSGEQHSHFRRSGYDWSVPHVEHSGVAARHPVLDEHEGATIVRFSCNNIVRDDDDPVAELQQRWQQRFEAEHVEITYARNDMLIWDNWRLLHARNAFEDPHRHLRRIHIGHPGHRRKPEFSSAGS